VRYSIGLALALALQWVLLSGHLTVLLLSLGAASCLSVLAISIRMNLVDHEGAPIELPLRLVSYLPWLFWKIAKANVDVALKIVDPKLPISPRMITVDAGQANDLGRVIYANSITLTPGTVSVSTEGKKITVHALTVEAAEGVLTGEMDRRVSRLAGGR